DEVKVYDYSRTASQILADFSSRGGNEGASTVLGASDQAYLSNGLVGYWKMDETAANTCSGGANDSCDSSGNGFDGAWNGSATASTSAKFAAGTTFASATSDYVQVTRNATLEPSTNLTVGLWFKTSTASNGRLFSNGSNGTVGLEVIMLASGRIEWDVAIAGADHDVTSNSTSLADGQWHHFVGTYDGQKLLMYIDGVLQTQDADSTAGTVTYNNYNLYFGRQGVSAGAFYSGVLDEVRFYNRTFSPQEAANLYNFAPGPVGYYQFEEKQGTSTADNSGYGNAGTLVRDPSWVRGKYGSGLSFDGARSGGIATYVDLGDDTDFEKTQFTVGAWVYRTGTCGAFTECTVFAKGTTGTIGYSLEVKDNSGYKARLNLGDGQSVYGTTIIQQNTWYYIAASVDNDNIKVYVNGVLENTVTRTQAITFGSETAKIGNRNTNLDLGFSGSLDEVRFYNYVRSSKQIVEDMNAGHPAVGSPVGSALGHWKFDDGFGNVASNSGSLGSTLNAGMYNFANPASVTSGWTNDGKFGKALLYDGTNDFVKVEDRSELDFTGAFTLSAWVNPFALANAAPSNAIVGKYDNAASQRSYLLYINTTNGDIQFETSSNGASGGSVTVDSNYVVPLRTWTYVSGVYDGSKMHVYINGKEYGTPQSQTSVFSGSAPFAIGARHGSGATTDTHFNGMIDEVKVYNYALSPSEVKLDMNQGKSLVFGAFGMDSNGVASNSANATYCVPGDTTQACSPVGEWQFEEKQGTSANDTTGQTTGGTLINRPDWVMGKIGSALSFNGVNYVNTNNQFNFTSGQSFSVASWIKSSFLNISSASTYSIVSKGCGFVGTYALWYRASTTDADARFCIHDNAGTPVQITVVSTTKIHDNKWHYLVGVRNVTADTVAIYVDGILQNSTTDTTTSNFNRASNVNIGARGVDNLEKFQGSIDQPQIYNYALSQAQIAWDYNRGKPIASWDFDECQGTALNSSTGTMSATLSVGSGGGEDTVGTCTTASTAWGSGATGKFNYSVDLDGTDDAIYALSPGLPTNDFTASAWVNLGTATDETILMASRTGGDELRVHVNSSGQIELYTAGVLRATSA
ncbi:laminin G domain-containing protein, partial [Candidatus Saccharibacteria bacterium]|nr:laminin G domain-containing protein [Candidatus Saccharibacteria bacterium]